MNKENYKVGIVGAGIVGLYLSWKLSRLGHKVAVFEKKDKVGEKVCSGLVSRRIKEFLPFVDSLIENTINFCKINFPKKSIELEFKPAHLVIAREKLVQRLFELASDSGVEFIFNKEVDQIPQGFDRVIGCDGALSKVQKSLKLPHPCFRLAMRLIVSNSLFSNQIETWTNKQGFFWKIPRGSEIEYGSLDCSKEDFEEFCRKQNLDNSKLESALIPQGLIIPCSDNTTLCGDSLGLTKPWSGGGIIWQFTAADMLINNLDNLNGYHCQLKKFFKGRIWQGKKITSLVYFLGNNLPFLFPSKISIDNDFLKARLN